MCIRDRTYDATVVLADDGQYANFKLEFDPVSYTHLDVYKRQGLHGKATAATS